MRIISVVVGKEEESEEYRGVGENVVRLWFSSDDVPRMRRGEKLVDFSGNVC